MIGARVVHWSDETLIGTVIAQDSDGVGVTVRYSNGVTRDEWADELRRQQ